MFPIFVILGSCENHNFRNCSLQTSLLSKASDSLLNCLLCFAASSVALCTDSKAIRLGSHPALPLTSSVTLGMLRGLSVTLGMLRGLSALRCPCL